MRERPSALKISKQTSFRDKEKEKEKEHDDVTPFSVSKLLSPDADWDRVLFRNSVPVFECSNLLSSPSVT